MHNDCKDTQLKPFNVSLDRAQSNTKNMVNHNILSKLIKTTSLIRELTTKHIETKEQTDYGKEKVELKFK